jgi:hypothetical protein
MILVVRRPGLRRTVGLRFNLYLFFLRLLRFLAAIPLLEQLGLPNRCSRVQVHRNAGVTGYHCLHQCA